MKKGIVVLGHGSRASVGEANQVVFQITEMVKDKVGHTLVETAIMNHMSGLQSLGESVERLIAQGADHITVAPMFFFNGMHIQNDIPKEISNIQEKHSGVTVTMANHIGADARIADILVERVQEVS